MVTVFLATLNIHVRIDAMSSTVVVLILVVMVLRVREHRQTKRNTDLTVKTTLACNNEQNRTEGLVQMVTVFLATLNIHVCINAISSSTE